MPTIQTYQYTVRDLEGQATQIKNLLIDFIFEKQMLSVKDADDLRDNYAIIVRKPSFFRRLVGKYKNTEDKPSLIVVRQETLGEPDEEEYKPPIKLVPESKPKGDDECQEK